MRWTALVSKTKTIDDRRPTATSRTTLEPFGFVLVSLTCSQMLLNNARARGLLEYAGHFYEQSAIVSDWSTSHAIAATRTYRGMHGHLMTITALHEAPVVQAYFGLVSFWLASSNVGVGGTLLWTAGPETGIAVPPYMAPASEITVKQCVLYSGFNWFSSADCSTKLDFMIQ
jgi:hypothetical protein